MIIKKMKYKEKEARYFLERMEENEANTNKEHFLFNYSAFVHATRTILQYAYKFNKKLYEDLVCEIKYKNLFKNIRDINIHKKPISTVVTTSSDLNASMTISSTNRSAKKAEKTDINYNKPMFYYCFPNTKYKYESINLIAKKHIKEINNFIDKFNNRI